MTAIKIGRGRSHGSSLSGFAVEILYPGLALEAGDSGIGAIGRIDRAQVRAGHIIRMHPHKDDEILTYLRTGAMLHRDTVGNEERVTATRLMMMNAGKAFQHEEEILGPGDSTALQIFLRPRASDLDAEVQFHDFRSAVSRGAWRLLAAPEGAPLTIRAQVWVQDAQLPAGGSLALPALQAPGAERLLYVFSGAARVGAVVVRGGESLYARGETPAVTAEEDADLVLFTTDPTAPVFKGGMFSGNVLSP